jgi:hypothetical protein
MSFLSSIIIAAFEKELVAVGPEVEAYMMQALGTLGSELMAYVTTKVVANNPPKVPVQTPQSVE